MNMLAHRLALLPLAAAATLLASCFGAAQHQLIRTDATAPPVFHAEENPERLSQWNVLHLAEGQLHLTSEVVPYDLNSGLFTDYAHKLRTIHLPAGTKASYDSDDVFAFPVGTIITKTFYYPTESLSGEDALILSEDMTAERLADGFALGDVRLIETRILVHRADGWAALPYVWNEDQTDAVLKRTGASMNLRLTGHAQDTEFTYIVPNANNCQGCHASDATTKAIKPIGPKARHLNKAVSYADGEQNQLHRWSAAGLLNGLPDDQNDIPKNADWSDLTQAIELRARSYLDINCSHCHQPKGPADTSGLFLTPQTPIGPALGVCKLPIAAGKGTGDRRFGIVPGRPDQSIIVYRANSIDPAIMMPELGRSLVHEEGVELIADWITALDGNCS